MYNNTQNERRTSAALGADQRLIIFPQRGAPWAEPNWMTSLAYHLHNGSTRARAFACYVAPTVSRSEGDGGGGVRVSYPLIFFHFRFQLRVCWVSFESHNRRRHLNCPVNWGHDRNKEKAKIQLDIILSLSLSRAQSLEFPCWFIQLYAFPLQLRAATRGHVRLKGEY